jgi:hypothetical protein
VSATSFGRVVRGLSIALLEVAALFVAVVACWLMGVAWWPVAALALASVGWFVAVPIIARRRAVRDAAPPVH